MNGVRININAGGSGSVAAVQIKFDLLYYSIEDTIEDLRSLNRRINNVNLEEATESIDKRIQTECAKKDNLETTAQQFNTFLSNAIYVDTSVAQNVKQSQKTFYKDFPWLRPQDVDAEPGFWEQLANSWNEFWGDVGDWIGNLVTNIVEWVKEHAVEIIVGLVCIVVGAVLTYLTGGAFLAALLAGLKAAAISGLIGGAISGVLALFTGGDFWEAFGDGFASGFMWGGIFSAISSAISAIRGFMHGANAVDDVVNVTDDVVNSTDDVANVADDAIKSFETPGGLKDKYPKAYEHLKGEVVNGKAKGYHYNMKGSNGKVLKVVEGPDKFGVYNAKVSINGIEKRALSSMFPDEWTAQQVSNAIDEAVNLASKLPVKPNMAYAYSVNLSNGMPIRVCFDNMGRFVNAFPLFTP